MRRRRPCRAEPAAGRNPRLSSVDPSPRRGRVMLIYARLSVKEARDLMPLRTARSAALTCLPLAALAPFLFAREALAAIDGARALRDVLQIAGTIGPRKTGTPGERRAIEYVQREMEA